MWLQIARFPSFLWLRTSPLASQVAQWLKNPPTIQETQEMSVWFLGGEDPLEEGMATHSSIPAWRIPWSEEPGGLQSMRSQRVRHDWSDWTSGRALSIDVCTTLPSFMHPSMDAQVASLSRVLWKAPQWTRLEGGVHRNFLFMIQKSRSL